MKESENKTESASSGSAAGVSGSFRSASASATLEWAEAWSQRLSAGDAVFLIGELGAGKTVIARGIAAGLDYEGVVNSPSFTLVNTYQGRMTVHHCDFYRLRPGDDLRDLGLEELLDSGALVLFEWSEDFPFSDYIPRYEIRIRMGNSVEERLIEWKFFE